ncbi:MAG: thermonuclease family protein [Allorhizobium sp.]
MPTASGMVAITASLVMNVACLALPAEAAMPFYERCGSGKRLNCVVDGDTLWSHGVKIRVADIDTPEIGQPRCAAEKALGERATIRFMELVKPVPSRCKHGRDGTKISTAESSGC